MPDKVMTVYAIGTGHTYIETYNVLVQLCNDTSAYRILVTRSGIVRPFDEGSETPDIAKELDTNWTQNDQVSVLVDGPKLGTPGAAKDYLDAKCQLLKAKVNEYKPQTVNLVGHSRGGVLSYMVASSLGSFTGSINLIMIDPVAWASMSEIITLPPYIKNYRRFIMEDDSHDFIFPLMTVKNASGQIITGPASNIRLPGTHGTGTQLNPVIEQGSELKKDEEYVDAPVWPIGGVVYLTIRQEFSSWGTKFNLPFTVELLIDTYARILVENPPIRTSTGGYKIRINNMDPCSLNSKQKLGEANSSRNVDKLNEICTNNYRFSPLFVNEQHYSLFSKRFGKIAACIPPEFTQASGRLLTLQQKEQYSSIYSQLDNCMEEVEEMLSICPNMGEVLLNFLPPKNVT